MIRNVSMFLLLALTSAQGSTKMSTDSFFMNTFQNELLPYLKAIKIENSDLSSHWSALLDEQIQSLKLTPDVDAADLEKPKANLIYNILRQLIREKLDSLPGYLDVEDIDLTGDGQIGFLLKNIILVGFDQIEITLEEGTGYNINNFTFKFPQLRILADHYELHGVNNTCLRTIDGEGNFRVVFSDFTILAKIDVKYFASTQKFHVGDVPTFEIALGRALFELEDLGQNGYMFSNFINAVVGDVVEEFVKALNAEIHNYWEEQWKGTISVFIEDTMNKVLCPIIMADPSVCDTLNTHVR